jgi:NACalpha-BTF3-like transcription factor
MAEEVGSTVQESGQDTGKEVLSLFQEEPELETGEETTEEAGQKGEGTEEIGEAEGEGEGEKQGEEEVTPDPRDAEIAALRSMTRSMKKALDTLKKDQEVHRKSLKDNDLLPEADETPAVDVQAKQQHFEQILAVMEVNPKYEDVHSVVTQANVDSLLENLALQHIKEHGGDLADTISQLEDYVWTQPNPYKLLYEKIKPTLQKPAAASTQEGQKKKTIPPVATSLAALPASQPGTGGWTAAKIDGMNETELDKVPADVYAKYMAGELN